MANMQYKLAGYGKRSQPANKIGSIVLTLILLAILLGTLGVTLSIATYKGMNERGFARSPVWAENTANTKAYFHEDAPYLTNNEPAISVISLIPLDKKTPPPIGLTRWPEPGEVFLSPALAQVEKREKIASSYGKFAGLIDTSGLATPTELLAYTNPNSPFINLQEFQTIQGFKKDIISPDTRFIHFGFMNYNQPLQYYLIGYAIIVGIPLLTLAIIGFYFGLSDRRTQSKKLHTLGFNRLSQATWHFGKIRTPLFYSSLIALVIVAILSKMNTPIPLTGIILYAKDVENSLPLVLLTLLGTQLIYTTIWIFISLGIFSPTQKIKNKSTKLNALTYDKKKVVLCLNSLPILTFFSYYISGTESIFALIILLLSVLTLSLTLGHLIRFCIIATTTFLRKLGLRFNSPETLVGAANLRTNGATLSILSLTIAVSITSFAIINAFVYTWTATSPETRTAYNNFHGKILEMNFASDMPKEIYTALDKSLQSTKATARTTLISSQHGGNVNNFETLITIKSFQKNKPLPANPRTDTSAIGDYLKAYSDTDTKFSVSTDSTKNIASTITEMQKTKKKDYNLQFTLLIDINQPNAPALLDIRKSMISNFYPPLAISSPESSWVTGEMAQRKLCNWMMFFSLLGICYILLGIGIIITDERYNASQKLAPLCGISGRKLHIGLMSALRVGVPMGIGIFIGTTIGILLSISTVGIYEKDLSPVLTFTKLTLSTGFIATLIIWSTLTIISKQRITKWKN